MSNLDQRKGSLSAAKRALLEQRLRGTAPSARPAGIPRRPEDAEPVLSHGQEQLWVLHQLAPESAAYTMVQALHLEGPLDADALEASVSEVVERHEGLRTTFPAQGGRPRAVVQPVRFTLPVDDLSDLPEDERLAEADARMQAVFQAPFDLAAGPLLRVRLFRLADEEHRLALAMHHIVSDEWSLDLFWREVAAFYQARTSGGSSTPDSLPIQYADYAHWQRQARTQHLADQVDYWRERLAGLSSGGAPPLDRPRPVQPSFRGAECERTLSPALTASLRALAREEGVTPFVLLLAAFKTLLFRYTERFDLALGTPVTVRNRPELEPLIGYLLNTLVVRTDLGTEGGARSFREVVHRVRQTTLDAFAHQEAPFEQLVEALNPDRRDGPNPFFQVMFVQHQEPARLQLAPDLDVRVERPKLGAAKFDLTLFVADGPQLSLTAEYDVDLYEAGTIERMLGHLEVLLGGVVADPERPLLELPLLTEAERHTLLRTWGAAAPVEGPPTTLHRLIEVQAKQLSTSVAVYAGGQSLTYLDLDRRANRLARRLHALGVGPDVRVGVCAERSPDLIVALLGVLKAGAAYVPLDPAYPAERLRYITADAQAPVVLVQPSVADALPETEAQVLLLDDEAFDPDDSPLGTEVQPEHLAYVIYTSGSTGQPKGVLVEHRHVVASTRARLHYYEAPVGRFLLLSSFAFDSSVAGLFWTLASGGALVLPAPGAERDVTGLAALVEAHEVTHTLALPSLYNLLLDVARPGQLGSLQTVIVAGEACPPTLPTQHADVLPHTALYNEYGPTEATVWCTAHRIDAETQGRRVPIGGPIPGTRLYVLDAAQRLVPPGLPGELYVGGAGVARGYLGRPELTAERFVPDPFVSDERLYRTGDRVRWRPDEEGTLDFLGRVDAQVKVRGHRIEPGEVASALMAHEAVRESAVAARDGRLVAYLVFEDEGIDTETLRRFLQRRLPDYMIPATFVTLEGLPRTPNGKVDDRALPAPSDTGGERTGRVAPRDALEHRLLRLWETTLGAGSLGVRDDFFEAGGHSLLAARLFAEIEQTLGRKLPLSLLFQISTVEALATVLRDDGWEAPWSSLVPLQPGGTKPPVYLVHSWAGNLLFYRDIVAHLDPDQPVYGIQAVGLDGEVRPFDDVEAMAAHYVGQLRAFQPKGPYALVSMCFGSLIVYEMAQQLRAAGEEVAVQINLDSGYVGRLPDRIPNPTRLAHDYTFRQVLDFKDEGQLGPALRAYLAGQARRAAATARQAVRHPRRFAERVQRKLGRAVAGDGEARQQSAVEQAHRSAANRYRPVPYPGEIVLIRSEESAGLRSRDWQVETWAQYAERLTTHVVPGGHPSLLKAPYAEGVARHVQACLDEAFESVDTEGADVMV